MPSGLTDPKARAFWNEAVQEKRLVGMEFVEVWADVERALDFEGLTNKEGL
jgi:arginase family enzyme